MTFASFMHFYEKLTWAFYDTFVIVAETKGVPWQRIRKWCHDNISVLVAHGDTGAKENVTEACLARMVGCSRIPGSRGSTAWQPRRNDNRSRADITSKHASHTTHAFIRGRSFSAVIPSKHAFETVWVRWDIGEVDVHRVSSKQSYMFGMELGVSMFFGVIV